MNVPHEQRAPALVREHRTWDSRTAIFLVGVLLTSFSPSKALGAGAGWVAAGLGILLYPRLRGRNVVRLGLVLTCYLWACALYMSLTEGARWQNMALFGVTGSTCLPLLLRIGGSDRLATAATARTLLGATILVEGTIGVAQAIAAVGLTGTFDGATGDAVTGTISLVFGRSDGTGSNQMFGILISTCLLGFVGLTRDRLRGFDFVVVGLAVCSFVLASVMHAIAFFTLGLIAAVVLSSRLRIRDLLRLRRSRISLLGIGGLIGLTMVAILPRNVSLAADYAAHLLGQDARGVGKPLITVLTITELPLDQRHQAFIGLGPGQFSSRAALIASGEYLSTSLPIPTGTTPYTSEYLLPLWRTFFDQHEQGGSTYFPFYSWLSLFGEFGLLGVLVVFAFGLRVIGAVGTHVADRMPFQEIAARGLLLYVALLGFQDNYWEWTQSVTLASVLMSLWIGFSRASAARAPVRVPGCATVP